MRLALVLAMSSGLSALAGVAQAAATVQIKDAVARVTVVPEARSDVRVEILSSNPRLPLEVRTFGGRTVVDGGLRRRIHNCRGPAGNPRVDVGGVGQVGWREMPQVVIHTPRDANVEAGGAVFGSVGRSANLDLANAGCGDWTVANVEGRLRLNEAGSGDVRAGSAGEAHIRVAGSGDVWTAEVRGPLQVDIAGSGDVTVAAIGGALDARVAGAGDVRVRGGHAPVVSVSIAGSGDVDFGGVADRLSAKIMGSGDVRVRQVRGPVSKMVMGSGGVSVGR
ncbi:MAG TPA: DUF2807 domain-containing protein [Phenylobacterium sp.]|uniref:GIN domain-containing protein n=1 Tax=Phenylobacterium sp. TaxID=1871053 RepID=UPI002CAA409C|nr:DUF2807 domain-containing protein [Phenylobacterium sp.]HSV01564.1 DUF2807 domain-containing protein [Phenylobacterium sp.]